ncbi:MULTISPECIES: hypothetical protein [Streptomyces]|uniref:hypothetical protein n=1 Tax=Streptomyces TaxID=1883 RepID=UPI0029BE6802|nr:hypothetical protein [Streptomyces sp. NE06-03C]MDX2920261.1 hypothetical protein [Streptomyces sp. NE06-03C]
MPAPTHTRSHRPAADGVGIRLPWWAIALPAVAFAGLLLMVLSPGQAQAATADPAFGQLIERTFQLLFR